MILGVKLIFQLLQVRIESGGSDVYHPKAELVRDWEKKRTLRGSDTEIIPSCVRYRLTCSIELAPAELGELWEPILGWQQDQIVITWIRLGIADRLSLGQDAKLVP